MRSTSDIHTCSLNVIIFVLSRELTHTEYIGMHPCLPIMCQVNQENIYIQHLQSKNERFLLFALAEV